MGAFPGYKAHMVSFIVSLLVAALAALPVWAIADPVEALVTIIVLTLAFWPLLALAMRAPRLSIGMSRRCAPIALRFIPLAGFFSISFGDGARRSGAMRFDNGLVLVYGFEHLCHTIMLLENNDEEGYIEAS
jgi:hypothetical protein